MRLAAQLKGGGLRLLPERKVVKAAEVTAVRDARALLDDAAAEADRIRHAATEAYEHEKRRGYQDGLAAGGDAVAKRLSELAIQGSELMAGLESRVPDIVISALRQVLGTFDDTELAIQTVKHVLRMFRKETDLSIRVPPERLEGVRARIDELSSDTSASIEVVADRHLSAGGCVVESELGSVDASIEAQLAVLEQAMRKDLAALTRDAAPSERGPSNEAPSDASKAG